MAGTKESGKAVKGAPVGRAMPGRFAIGFNVLLQIALGVVIVLGLNLLSYRYYWRQDLSPTGSYTLSSSTVSYLRKLGKEVELTVIFVRGAPLYEYLQGLTDEYRRNGKRLVKVEFVDPTRDLERTEQLKAENALTLDQSGILLKANKRSRFIKESELFIMTPGADKDHPRVDIRAEDALTSAMDGLLSGGERKFYLVSGKGARVEADTDWVLKALSELGQQQNFAVQTLNLGGVEQLPGDANGLIFAGVRYDLSEREIGVLREYWERKRSGLLFLLDPTASTPRLDAFLAAQGIKPRGDRVLYAESTASGPKKQFSVEASFSGDAVLTRALKDATTTLSGQTESLQLMKDEAGLRDMAVSVLPLIIAKERYWGETSYLDELPLPEGEDTLPPVVVAASAERGAVEDERLRVDSSRLVVVGNAALLDARTRLAPNQDFLAASVNWMMNRERLIGITPKPRPMYRLQLTKHQSDLIFWMTALVAPASVLVLGLLVWSGRRAS